ncbi:helix-turn-helix domain-containing protein [Methanosarcina sp. MSH10X1]
MSNKYDRKLAFTVQVYPDKEQKSLMEKHFGSSQFVYSILLDS